MKDHAENKMRGTVPLEIALTSIGIFAAMVMLTVLFSGHRISNAGFDAFRSGYPGAMLVGFGTLAGFAAIPLFVINLSTGNRNLILLRLILLFAMLALIATLGSLV